MILLDNNAVLFDENHNLIDLNEEVARKWIGNWADVLRTVLEELRKG
jgi:hypothetical protein